MTAHNLQISLHPADPLGDDAIQLLRDMRAEALRPMNAEIAEVRRVYVAPSVRRRGIARRLLAELEGKAIKLGYAIVRLETGNRQPEATALYESCGFRRIAPYGSHVDDPLSICFEKKLTRDGTVMPKARGADGGIAIRLRSGYRRPAATDAHPSVASDGLRKTSRSCE